MPSEADFVHINHQDNDLRKFKCHSCETSLYTSASRIFVERNLPAILAPDMRATQSVSYLFTQAELICSTPVLAAAAESPENSNLSCFRDIDDRVGLLKQSVRAFVGNQDDIINITAELSDPHDAARIVNSVVDAYISKYAEQRRNNTTEVLTILRNEKERRDVELELRRTEIDKFRQQNPELAVQTNNDNVITKRFGALSDVLSQTEIELLEAKARYYRVKEMFAKPNQRLMLLEIAVSQQAGKRELDLANNVQQVEQALISERARWGEGHPRVRLLNDSLTELRGRLAKQQQAVISSYVDNLRQEYELLSHKRNELRAAYDKQYKLASEVSSKSLQLASLEDALERTERTCDILDERIKELNLSEDVGAMNVSIMEVAGPSTIPSYPVRSRFLAGGMLLGAAVGFGLGWLRDLLDHRLRSIDEIASVLQLPILGALPHFGDKAGPAQAGQLFHLTPRSPAAEAVRTLRTAIHFGLGGRETRVIAITSPLQGDGKSTVASNLAIALAQSDLRVLIIDADLRKPILHQIFEVAHDRGLGSVLAERHPVEDTIVPTGIDSLELLPCGPCPHNPVELLNNGYFASLLETLKGRYDKIIIDAPPVMPVADARVIAALSEATLLVLRAERSTRRLSLGARNELWKVRAARLGIVVNRVPMRKQSYYSYGESYAYGESYGYGQYPQEELSNRSKGQRIALPARDVVVATASGSMPS